MAKHTPTPWKVVCQPNFGNGYIYTSIQPVEVDADAMEHLRMAGGEHHVCRFTHTPMVNNAERYRADAEFIVKAVNSYDDLLAMLKHAVHWHDQISAADVARYQAVIAAAEGK